MKDIEYEWCVETVDEYGDVVDLDFSANPLAPLRAYLESPEPGLKHELCIVRVDWRARGKRSWAYVNLLSDRIACTIPEYFTDAHGREVAKVPHRFSAQLLAAMTSIKQGD